ncbi:hypothetical protein SAMN05428959_105354 [Duganella sp. CF517]|uniref:hypothetical protein n=1 Tax=Duganella sp. CF517 TaxID=1881038 RepID=UPI0008CCB646|nr:hypothetical protein [Duganella sp. CF517]SEO20841.1 hypothetical protein SAMN05428959_105354 [Duganella sp. CF517]
MNINKIKYLLAWLVLALSASALRFKVILQSDTLFLDDLFSDLLRHGGRWAEWKFSSAPAFVPDMLLYWLAFPLFGDPAARIFFVSLVQVFLVAAALLWCARRIDPALGKSAAASLLLVLALFTLASAKSGMWLYFYTTNNHLATLLFGLTGTGLMLRYLERPGAVPAAWLVAGCVAAVLSTQLFTLSFTLPVLALLGGAWLMLGRAPAHRATRRSLARLAAMVFGAQVLAMLLAKVVIRNAANEGRVRASPETAGVALRNLLQAIKTAFAPDNGLTMACAMLVLLALLFLAYRLLRACALGRQGLTVAAADWRFGAAAALLAVVSAVNLFGVVLSGGFADQFGLRYLMFPMALALVLGVIRLDQLLGARAWPAAAAQLALGAVVAIGAGRLTLAPPPPMVDGAALAAGCLARIEGAGFPLRAGIADYWNARSLRYLLPAHNPMLATDSTLAPSFHVSTLGPVLRPADYPSHRYNFAVLYGAVQPVDPTYTAATLRASLPAPARVEQCAGGRLEIWLYQDDSLERAVKQAGAAWARKEGR